MQALIFCGVQGSGKSTFYRQRFFDTHIRINLDMLRTRHRESIFLRACIEGKQPFVVDNTNATVVERARYLEPAKVAGFKTTAYYFQSNVQEALKRNEERPEHVRVPRAGLLGTYKQLQIPSRSEGFDDLFYVRTDGAGGFVTEEWRDEI